MKVITVDFDEVHNPPVTLTRNTHDLSKLMFDHIRSAEQQSSIRVITHSTVTVQGTCGTMSRKVSSSMMTASDMLEAERNTRGCIPCYMLERSRHCRRQAVDGRTSQRVESQPIRSSKKPIDILHGH